MASFSSSGFSTSAFSTSAFDFGAVVPQPPSEVTGGGGGFNLFHSWERRERKPDTIRKDILEAERQLLGLKEEKEVLEEKLPEAIPLQASPDYGPVLEALQGIEARIAQQIALIHALHEERERRKRDDEDSISLILLSGF